MEKQTDLSNYLEKLMKLIPSEIVLVYATIVGFLPKVEYGDGEILKLSAQLIIALILLVLIPFYLSNALSVKNKSQIVLTAIAFVIWVFYLGDPFEGSAWYKPWMAGTALLLFSLLPPIFLKSNAAPGNAEPQAPEASAVTPEAAIGQPLKRSIAHKLRRSAATEVKRSWREI